MTILNLVRRLHLLSKQMCTMAKIEEQSLIQLSKQLAPPLAAGKYKGQAGRIGIVGGSLEYTGAPYFSGISALKVGADLSHIFCAREAGPVIKSYSPELIVHPVLDDNKALELIEPWLDRLHVLVIGPGLGREPTTFHVVSNLIKLCRSLKKPLVIDADGLFLITQQPALIYDYPGVILTPNAIEFSRLFGIDTKSQPITATFDNEMKKFGKDCVVLRKGKDDLICSIEKRAECTITGSGRRCGGQGDLLSGAVATFYCWTLQNPSLHDSMRAIAACYAGCKLTRECNAKAFQCNGRSMTCSDMIKEIGSIFNENFEVELM